MAAIIPAILPTSLSDLTNKLEKLVGIATEVQIDIVDGMFAVPASWPYSIGAHEFAQMSALPLLEHFRFEMDLMVQNPEEVTGAWIQAGATRILAHIESTSYLPRLITDIKVKYGHEKGFAPDLLSFGLAVDIATDVASLEPYIPDVDYVQFMGVDHDGKQGEPFDEKVVEKIRAFRKLHPEIAVQVDGGVNRASAVKLLSVGVSRLVVGSDLWKASNLKEEYDRLVALSEEHGIYE